MQPNSIQGTFIVATVLCVFCSLLVAGTAEFLKEDIENNEQLYFNKNVLLAAGLCEPNVSSAEVEKLFEERIRAEDIALPAPEGVEPEAGGLVPVEPPNALMGVRDRPASRTVYRVLGEGSEETVGYIFPIEGKGLWSTLKGFLAIESDGQTVMGITFYAHKETPGLGGEVGNSSWKAKWKGKQMYDAAGDVDLDVIKGTASNDYEIDGLSGATITSNGVDGMMAYWFGEQGYGPWLKEQTAGAKKS
ncbi:MAG: NADH:ubiquinone reductase (Na(+)-transporting) subunit C [Planctomycetota bacterium]